MNTIVTERQFTGRHMFMIMVSFFLVVVGVNVLLAVLASTSWTGLVVKNSYVASQEFNGKTEEMEKSARMNVRADLAYANGVLEVRLLSREGKPVAASAGTVKLGRPADDADDRTLTLACKGNGVCVADTALGTGLWRGEIAATLADGATWQRVIELRVMEK